MSPCINFCPHAIGDECCAHCLCEKCEEEGIGYDTDDMAPEHASPRLKVIEVSE